MAGASGARGRDLAVHYDCSAATILGHKIPATEWGESPYAAGDYDDEDVYGSLGFWMAGKNFDFPISQRARESLLRQIERFTPQALENRRDWLECSTLNNRILFLNPSALRSLTLNSDDDRAPAYYGHPEIYLAMQDWDQRESIDWGPVLTSACEEHVAQLGEKAVEEVSQTQILFVDGSEPPEPAYIYDEWVITALLALDSHSFHVPDNAMLLIEHTEYHVSEFVNLSHVALLNIPREEFHRRSAPED